MSGGENMRNKTLILFFFCRVFEQNSLVSGWSEQILQQRTSPAGEGSDQKEAPPPDRLRGRAGRRQEVMALRFLSLGEGERERVGHCLLCQGGNKSNLMARRNATAARCPRPFQIPYYEFERLGTLEEQVEYLHDKIFPIICKFSHKI